MHYKRVTYRSDAVEALHHFDTLVQQHRDMFAHIWHYWSIELQPNYFEHVALPIIQLFRLCFVQNRSVPDRRID
jgi:hypothetical protein